METGTTDVRGGVRGIDETIERLRRDPELADRVAHWREVPPRAAETVPLPDDLHPGLADGLREQGIESLYTHQHRAFRLAREGRSFVVATPTASGKSLCAHLPILTDLRERPGGRAIYLFPTKALSRDQEASLDELIRPTGGLAARVYDGDTRPTIRRRIREEGDIVCTNPHMLHVGILPNHPKWDRLFRDLRWVVVDEVHHYRGVFGSHLTNVLRRLRRIARHYGSDPSFIGASATIGNPRELAGRLFETEVEAITASGAPRGARHYCLWNPPLVHPDLDIRGNAIEEARRLAAFLLRTDVQFLVFARSRNKVEVLARYLKDEVRRLDLPEETVAAYRGGYLPDLRRRIERGIRSGAVRGVVATNALELGIDIGGLDVVCMAGYPGSVASFYQQAGRAGRGERPSLAILVGRSTALDQYLLSHPDALLDRPGEDVVCDPENLVIKTNHVKCSAFEVPFREGEGFGGEGGEEIVRFLDREARLLHRSNGAYYWVSDAFPAQAVSLNAADTDGFVIQDADSGDLLGETDRPGALTEIHPGAIWGFQGEQYQIDELDYEGRRAYARKVEVDYYTQADLSAELRPLTVDRVADDGAAIARAGDVEVTVSAGVYKKVRFYTRENVGAGEIHVPPETMETRACWWVFPEETVAEAGIFGDGLPGGRPGGSLLGVASLLRGAVPLFIRCDPGDVRIQTETRSRAFDAPTLWLYDVVPGGVGLARRAWKRRGELLATMLEIVEDCACASGCPACVGVHPGLGPDGKETTTRLLRLVVRSEEPSPAPSEDARPIPPGETIVDPLEEEAPF